MMEASDLMALSSFAHGAGPTFFGHRHTSTIDHIVGPMGMQHLVLSCHVRRGQMRHLQLINTKAPRDHAPLAITIAAELHESCSSAWPPLDRDRLTDSLRKGVDRAEYLQTLEAELQALSEEEWSALVDAPTPDAAWAHLRDALRAATWKTYRQAKKVDEEYEVYKVDRMKLLDRRRRLRAQMEGDEADEAQLSLELALASRRCRKMREARWRERDAGLEQELAEA